MLLVGTISEMQREENWAEQGRRKVRVGVDLNTSRYLTRLSWIPVARRNTTSQGFLAKGVRKIFIYRFLFPIRMF